MSEALIFESTNPQYEDRLFIELQVQNTGRACSDKDLPVLLKIDQVSDFQHSNFTFYIHMNSKHVVKSKAFEKNSCKNSQGL